MICLLGFTFVLHGQDRLLYVTDKGGRVLDNGLQFGVYEKLRGVVQAKRNVTKLTYVSYIFTLSSVSLGLCGSVSK